MKKRVKLLTTIASLCLAVALMAFGVYAAAEDLEKTVSGSISYTATGVDGSWTWEAEITKGSATFANGEITVTSEDYAEWDGEGDLLAIVLGTNADVTIEVTGSFTTTSGSSNGATLSITDNSSTGVNVDTETGSAPASGASAGTVTATITYTAGSDANTNQRASWSITFVAVSDYDAE